MAQSLLAGCPSAAWLPKFAQGKTPVSFSGWPLTHSPLSHVASPRDADWGVVEVLVVEAARLLYPEFVRVWPQVIQEEVIPADPSVP